MYDSLQLLKQLPDDVVVYPAHGPGSACGKNLGRETWSTIGIQKKMNYALRDQPREEFIKAITDGLTKPPQYFPLNAKINREGYASFDEVMQHSLRALSVDEFQQEMKKENSIVVDTRHEHKFEKGFVPRSIFIGLHGRYAEWVGTLLNINDRILIVADPGREKESILRMARVGYDNVVGFLEGGFDAWKNAGKNYDMLISIDAEELELDYAHDRVNVIDVRKETEFDNGHVAGATNVVLQYFDEHIHKLDEREEEDFYVHCQGGYRSVIAASLMKRRGFQRIKNVHGGWGAISKTHIPVSMPVASPA
jgi:rhodanese-related sulfurtransferase